LRQLALDTRGDALSRREHAHTSARHFRAVAMTVSAGLAKLDQQRQ